MSRSPFHLAIACCVLASAGALGCDGGYDDGVAPGLTATFTPSGTPVSPNVVRLTRVSGSGALMTLEAVLGGPTTSSDLYSFAFDLVFGDPIVVQYVPGSIEAGTALAPTGGQNVAVEAVPSGDRVIIGVTKVGGGAGNGVGASGASVIRLTLKVLKTGTSTISFSGSGQPVALDSSGAPIGSITFDASPATISGS